LGSVPVRVVLRQRVGDVVSGHQEDGPEEAAGEAAGGQAEEGGAERDAGLMQQLEVIEVVIIDTTSNECVCVCFSP